MILETGNNAYGLSCDEKATDEENGSQINKFVCRYFKAGVHKLIHTVSKQYYKKINWCFTCDTTMRSS